MLGEGGVQNSAAAEPQFAALVERQIKQAEHRLGQRLEHRIDQLLAATGSVPAAAPTVDMETAERLERLETRLEQTWEVCVVHAAVIRVGCV